jgi:hypothetical protein
MGDDVRRADLPRELKMRAVELMLVESESKFLVIY